MSKHHVKPGSPEDLVLQHYGVKGMRWGVRKEDVPVGRLPGGQLDPATQQIVGRVTRTDTPQLRGVTSAPENQKQGLTADQKILITYGVLGAAAAGYIGYTMYQENKAYQQSFSPEGLEKAKRKEQKEVQELDGMALPKDWDVSGLKDGPLSDRALGDLTGDIAAYKLLDTDNLVINTSRGYADILPAGGLPSPHAVAQHDSAIRALEEMRAKYPSIRNMNVEVVPMSKVSGMEDSGAAGAVMCVMAMRPGEARLMYNDTMDPPSLGTIAANKKHLPGLGVKDYVAHHEMGHLLAVAGGQLPPTDKLLGGKQGMMQQAKDLAQYHKAEPKMHQQIFLKHGFTFKELSKLSGYAATEPAEAMAELHGHYANPEMRKKLTPDQITRAKAMFDEMGGLS